MPVIALLMGILFFILNRHFENKAYRCNRCGKILCYHCEKHLLWRNMCLQCYRSLVKLDELDAKERVARLLTVYEHQKKRRTMIKALSFLIPGSGQLYAGTMLYGLLFPLAVPVFSLDSCYQHPVRHKNVRVFSSLAECDLGCCCGADIHPVECHNEKEACKRVALEGSLKDFGLADILQLIFFQRKTGVLTMESRLDKVRLLVIDGNIVGAESKRRIEANRLGKVLVKKGLITEKDLQAVLNEQKNSNIKLGNLLVRKGIVQKEEIEEILVGQIKETVDPDLRLERRKL